MIPAVPNKNKNQFAYMVCLFLAEGMRTRKLSLKRAGEIAEKVLANINLIDTEEDFLKLVKELSKDFDELVLLENKVLKQRILDQKRNMESHVRNFSIQILPSNPKLALLILEKAAENDMTVETLAQTFPEFDQYLRQLPSLTNGAA